ncbi:MAG: hypothetical protein CR994_09620 [Maribacter sp.]|nr:MAG: hypothetical protein CR994_09620 [Maribacter sp.]
MYRAIIVCNPFRLIATPAIPAAIIKSAKVLLFIYIRIFELKELNNINEHRVSDDTPEKTKPLSDLPIVTKLMV